MDVVLKLEVEPLITILQYADDTTLIAENANDLQTLVKKVQEQSEKWD